MTADPKRTNLLKLQLSDSIVEATDKQIKDTCSLLWEEAKQELEEFGNARFAEIQHHSKNDEKGWEVVTKINKNAAGAEGRLKRKIASILEDGGMGNYVKGMVWQEVTSQAIQRAADKEKHAAAKEAKEVPANAVTDEREFDKSKLNPTRLETGPGNRRFTGIG